MALKPLPAQDTVPGTYRFDKNYFKSWLTDTRHLATRPFCWERRQWLTAAGVAASGTLIYLYDDRISEWFTGHTTPQTEWISSYLISDWGSGIYSLPLLGGIYLTGSPGSRHRQVALTGIKAFFLSAGAGYLVKLSTHRYRPHESDPPDPYRWDGPFPVTLDHLSFPSGHTTTAFAVASVLACGYKDKTWVGITSYSVAGLVGLSRIHDGEHWASDVLAGAALGTAIGISLCRLNIRNLEIQPQAGRYGNGVKAVFTLSPKPFR
ncbi:MAG: hypothetical protein Kow00127_25480 [Bacteroidales bacterium]